MKILISSTKHTVKVPVITNTVAVKEGDELVLHKYWETVSNKGIKRDVRLSSGLIDSKSKRPKGD